MLKKAYPLATADGKVAILAALRDIARGARGASRMAQPQDAQGTAARVIREIEGEARIDSTAP
jgi:hypothetical protein